MLSKWTEKPGYLFFRMRGYTPVPFLMCCTIFSDVRTDLLLAGLSMIIVGEALRIWAVGHVGRNSRKTHDANADTLIISGPYRYTRNPIYIGNTSIYLGFALLSNIFFPYFVGLTGIFFSIVYWLIARYEEVCLGLQFGPAYASYAAVVPGFFGCIGRKPPAPESNFQFRKVIASEWYTWLALMLALGLILVSDRVRHG